MVQWGIMRGGGAAVTTCTVALNHVDICTITQIMALAQLGRLEEAVMTMEEGLKDTVPSSSRACTIYSDTVSAEAHFPSPRRNCFQRLIGY